jgi:hypothetical protein
MAANLQMTAAAHRARIDHQFYCWLSRAIAVLVIAAFAKAVFRAEFESDAFRSPLTHAHALVYFSWVALFATQTSLITAERRDIHRKLGVLGLILVCLIVLLSAISTIRMFALGMEKFFFANPHIEVIVFVLLIVPAFVLRRQADIHKRLVVLATVTLIGAATSHLPYIGRLFPQAYLVVQDSFIVAGVMYDVVSRGRVHHTYIWGGFLIVFSQLLGLEIHSSVMSRP